MTVEAAARARRVVVVDDTADLRALLTIALRHGGFEVVGEAADGRAGIDVVRRLRPDVVLLDLSMPDMGGAEALPTIRDLVPGATIMVLSGSGEEQAVARSLGAGADGYEAKDASIPTILARLRDLTGGGDGPPAPSVPHPRRPGGRPLAAAASELDELRRTVAAAAHEIRGSVAVLIGVAEVIDRDDDLAADDRQRLLDSVVRQARRLDTLTADLLTTAQADR